MHWRVWAELAVLVCTEKKWCSVAEKIKITMSMHYENSSKMLASVLCCNAQGLKDISLPSRRNLLMLSGRIHSYKILKRIATKLSKVLFWCFNKKVQTS